MVLDSIACHPAYAVWAQGIYFFTPRDEQGHTDLTLYDLPSGKRRKIMTTEQPGAMYVGVSPDGRTVLYSANDQRIKHDLMLVENFR